MLISCHDFYINYVKMLFAYKVDRITKIKVVFMVALCMLIILSPLFVQLMHTQIVLKLLNY